MFGSLGFNEILFIMVLALLIFGPKRLPQIGRTMGKAIGEFRRASSDLKRSMEVELTLAEERERVTAKGPDPVSTGGAEPRQESRDMSSFETEEIPQVPPGEDAEEPDFGVPEPSEASREAVTGESGTTEEAPGTEPTERLEEPEELGEDAAVERSSVPRERQPTEGS